MQQLPIDISDFERMRKEDYLYADKTRQIFDMLQYGNQFFLSRPRRFGKSMTVSILEALFEGKKELFKGLWIEDKIEWESYPVVRIDFARVTYGQGLEILESSLNGVLEDAARKYEVPIEGMSSSSRMDSLLRNLHEKTGKQIVLLIDEYDKPITEHLTELETAEANRKWLRNFYDVVKAKSGIIRFLFITGISKFAKMSIFSVMNNITDISLEPLFNDLLGFTEEEMQRHFSPYLEDMAQKTGTSTETLLEEIRNWYDGYSWDGIHRLYNPYSIVHFFKRQRFDNFWFQTGTPEFLIQLIKKRYAPMRDTPPHISEFEGVEVTESAFNSYNLENIRLVSLLVQTGYLTVGSADGVGTNAVYTLTYPNLEVRTSMSGYILEAFVEQDLGTDIQPKAIFMKKALSAEDPEKVLELVRAFFAGIPYNLQKDANEAYYHSLFILLMNLLGIRLDPERLHSKGRCDGVLHFADKVFILEFKFADKGTMGNLLSKAAAQIALRQYYQPFLGQGKKVLSFCIGFLLKKGKNEQRELVVGGKMSEV